MHLVLGPGTRVESDIYGLRDRAVTIGVIHLKAAYARTGQLDAGFRKLHNILPGKGRQLKMSRSPERLSVRKANPSKTSSSPEAPGAHTYISSLPGPESAAS